MRKTTNNDVLANKKFSTINKDPAKLFYVSKKGIIIYPISEFEYLSRRGVYVTASNKKWYIEVDNNGTKKTFPKIVSDTDLEDSIWKTINHYYNLLTEKK